MQCGRGKVAFQQRGGRPLPDRAARAALPVARHRVTRPAPGAMLAVTDPATTQPPRTVTDPPQPPPPHASGAPPPQQRPTRAGSRARVGARQVIQEIDQALRALIRAEAFADRDVEVVFDAPTKDWAGRRNAPTVDVYLYDIREDMRRRARGVENEYEATAGSSAGTCRPGTSSCRTWSPPGPSVPRTSTGCCRRCSPASCGTTRSRPSCSPAPLSDLGLPVPLSVACRRPRTARFADVWSALGGELKPSLDVVITAADRHARAGRRRAGPPVVRRRPRPSSVARTAWPRSREGRAARSPSGAAASRRRGERACALPVNAAGVGLGHLFARVALVEARVAGDGRAPRPTTRRRTTRSAGST